MADKAISELIEATQVTQTDLFVLQQNETAKKLSGQTLINYLLKMIDGHGGIQSIVKSNTSGLVDTYTVTMADTTTSSFSVTNGRAISSIKETAANGLTRTYTIAFNDGSTEAFTVTDGRSITNISKTGTDGLADTYTITYNDGSTGKYTVTNGAQGEKGDTTYIWIKFASQEPTESSHSFGDVPDNWIGFYVGSAGAAPTDWMQYQWFKIKGAQGAKGDPAMLVSSVVTYQAGNSGTIIPSGTWSSDIPVVSQGKYLWIREVTQFNTGDPITKYSVSRMGLDGNGSVVSVCGVGPDENGNVALDASHVGALPLGGGDMTGPINMNGQKLSGLNTPEDDTDAVPKVYADKMLPKAGGTMTGPINMNGQKLSGLGVPTDIMDAIPAAFSEHAFASNGTVTDLLLIDSTQYGAANRPAMIYTGDVTTLSNRPSGFPKSGDFIGKRIVDWYEPNRYVVTIHETFPVPGRIWVNHYNVSTWSGWECAVGSVPMMPGVEYRTTERYLGKPVYTKVIDIGALPNAATKEVAHGVAFMDAVDIKLIGNNAGFTWTNHLCVSSIYFSGGSIAVTTTIDLSQYTAYVIIKYTKD